MPVLAAARKPPVNIVAGTAYSQGYSGGSVGPVPGVRKGTVVVRGLTFEHVKHSL